MNWDAIGAIGEVVGAIAVVLSLLYLAVQVRHGAKTTEDSATRDIFIAITDQLALIGAPQNRDVILNGLKGFRNLTAPDKMTFDGLMGGLITLCESIFISAETEIVGDETLENVAFYLRTRCLCYPGMLEWWEESRGSFISGSQAWIDRQIQSVDHESDFWQIK